MGSVTKWGLRGHLASRPQGPSTEVQNAGLLRFCKKGFPVSQYSLTGKDGSGFGSWKTVPAVPVPLSVSGKTVPTVAGSVPEPPWKWRIGKRTLWGSKSAMKERITYPESDKWLQEGPPPSKNCICWPQKCPLPIFQFGLLASLRLFLPLVLRALFSFGRFLLVAPYCAIPRDYLSDTPLLRDMGFLVSQHGQWGAIPRPPFLSVSPLDSVWSGGAIPPPQKGYLSDTCAIPYENKANECDTPLRDTISKGYCAVWGGISHWAAKWPSEATRPGPTVKDACKLKWWTLGFRQLNGSGDALSTAGNSMTTALRGPLRNHFWKKEAPPSRTGGGGR